MQKVNSIEKWKNVNVYEINNKDPKYVKEKVTELSGEICNAAVIVQNFNSSLSALFCHYVF